MIYRQVYFGSPGGFFWRFGMMAGMALVLAGILIAVYPQILVALVSTIVILCGLTLIGASWQARQAMRHRPPGGSDIIDM